MGSAALAGRGISWEGAFPAGWRVYLVRTGELTVGYLEPCEAQRCQGSNAMSGFTTVSQL